MRLRALRRDRAFRRGADFYLHQRAFADCLDRLTFVSRRFNSALLVGCPDPSWPQQLRAHAANVTVIEPGPEFARAAGAICVAEDQSIPPPHTFDLCLAMGTLDTVNDLPVALGSIRSSLRPDSLLMGAMAGGESLPQLRAAMFAADQQLGSASPHVHPRVDAPSLASLLSACGFVMPVVDIDRVQLSYGSLGSLVADLRGMAAGNILHARSRRPLSRAALAAAEASFTAAAGEGGRTLELIEILHFAAWTAASSS